MLEIENLQVSYGVARALHGVSLAVETGEIAAVIGLVGAGKSTLLDAVCGLNKRTGRIALEGRDTGGLTAAAIVASGVGYAPERGNLFAQMGVRENLLVGCYTARRDADANLQRVYELFPVLRERERQDTGTLSGGERQMVSLGRALMTSPRLLLIDEPTIGLSPKVCNDIAAALLQLNRQDGLTILIAEQNVNFALSLAQRIYLLETGSITRSGSAQELQREQSIRESYFGA